MKRISANWITLFAAATIVALPASGFAQTPPQTQPPQSQTPPTQTPPTDPPQSAQPAAQTPAPQGMDTAKAHLAAARNSLSQMTQLPAAAQLQGETRTQVSQLISSFNELITTQTDWKAAYAKVESNLSMLLGSTAAPTPDEPARPTGTAGATGTPGAVGTSGTAATGIDPAIRAKLLEFRSHLDKFEEAAGAPSEPAAAASATPPAATTPPDNPPTPPDTPPTAAAAGAAGAEDAPTGAAAEEIMGHIEAIETLLNAQAAAQAANAAGAAAGQPKPAAAGTDLTLTQPQLEQLKSHLAELRRLLDRK